MSLLDSLNWSALGTAAILGVMIIGLLREWLRTELVMLLSVGALLLIGVLTPTTAFAGFSNSACISIASLLVVAAGVHNTGALAFLDRWLPGRESGWFAMMLRLMLPVSLVSAFVNNTPLVAMLIPSLQRWTARLNLAPSKVMLPLSYAAILGGTITLMGSSTNLVISGLYEQATGAGFSFFDLTWVGLPVALAAILYFAWYGRRLLPESTSTESFAFTEERTEEYQFEVRISESSELDGKTIEEAGLRALIDVFLSHIYRDGRLVGVVAPTEILRPGDVLTFVGKAAAIQNVLEKPGIERAITGVESQAHAQLPLFEAVVANSSTLVDRTLKAVQFRERYQGVVLAIFRKNERIMSPLGLTALRPGDLLLIEAQPGFDARWNAHREEFYLVAPCGLDIRQPRKKKASIALCIFVAMVIAAATGLAPLATASFAAALSMTLFGCLPFAEIRHRIDIGLIVMIGASLALGEAVSVSGLGGMAAEGVVWLTSGQGILPALCILYLASTVMTELLSNGAVAALMLPVALDVAGRLNVDPLPFAIVIAVAASLSFATPFGYQTNLMVMAAGGYRTKDYLRSGLPMNAITMIVALFMVWLIWL